MKSPEKIVDHIVEWLNKYAEDSAMKGFVVGVSGGIDSAVTSTLCALTGKPVLCLEMPIHQNKDQVNRALDHIKWLEEKFSNVSHHTVPLTSVFQEFKTTVPSVENSDQQLLSLANTRARIRMTTLYYFAALHGYLVAGTGNKVEDFGVGFYTKYGDGGVDLSPIADLLKTQVYSLAKHLEIIDSIQKAAPTDGLWSDDRTDEDQLGVSYEILEWAMLAEKEGRDEKTFSEKELLAFKNYKKFNHQNKHKMEPIPVCEIPSHLF